MENLSTIGVNTGTPHLKTLVFRRCKLKLNFLATALLLASVFSVQAKDWRGIVPLHSTRSDVERLLGRPAIASNDFATFHLDEGRISFDFATGGCNDVSGIWNVSQGTVIRIVLIPKNGGLKFRDLRVDLTKLNKSQDEHVLNIFHYIDEQEGVRYEVDESDGTVPLIEYFPARKDEGLRCPPTRKP